MSLKQGSSRWRDLGRRIAPLAVIATALPAVLQAAAYESGAFSTWWLELLLYVPFPVYLVPALAALGLSFLLGWHWRVVAALTVLLVLTVVMGLVIGRSDTGTRPVRMMTYNVKAYLASGQEGGYDAIMREVAVHDPDIVVMQDAIDQHELPEAPPAIAARFVDRHVYAIGQYVVATRFPLRDCGLVDLDDRQRNYVRCVVTVDGIDVDLVTAHFVSPREGLNAARRERLEGVDDWQQNFASRLAQARKLAADQGARQRPTILAGDLNAPEASPVIRILLATGLRDAFSSAGLGYGYTHGHALKSRFPLLRSDRFPRFSFLRIDHILVSAEIGVTDSFVGGREASEHRPVIADLLLQRSR